MLSSLVSCVPPVLMIISAYLAFQSPGKRPGAVPRLAETLALAGFAAAVGAAGLLVLFGADTSPTLGAYGLGFAVRADAVATTMLVLVSFVGWIVLRYARTYMDGEDNHGIFTGWLSITLTSVMLLVTAGNLLQLFVGWSVTSYGLHKLLLHYPDRLQAQRAARKKALVARIGAGSLLLAAGLMVWRYGTGDIAQILETTQAGEASPTIWVPVLLALSALMKSAQFPSHGWLTEVMETPTPVSALLHAGIINAGGFLLIRFADLMLQAPVVLAILVMVGGFTALFASLVMLTQPTVKTSLAWSTIAQMGFMILQCGLALFPLALLHIVAHSLYKAHAFLASGMAVDSVAAIRKPGPVAVPDLSAVMKSFGVALVIYAGVGLVFGFTGKSPAAIALGAILIFGVAYLLAQGLADAAPRELTRRTALYSVATAVGYFTLQTAALWMTAGTLPITPPPGPLEWALILLSLLSFGLVALAQATFPLWANHPALAGFRVHLSHGLYANALFDRLVGNWSNRPR